MTSEEIRKLKNKYWAGETSIAEEQSLREYYATHDERDAIKAIFDFADEQRKITYDKKIVHPSSFKRSTVIRQWMAIAASLVVLVAAVWMFNTSTSNDNVIVIDDPEEALRLTQDAFAFLNGKIDDSSSSVKHGISHLDKTFIFKNL